MIMIFYLQKVEFTLKFELGRATSAAHGKLSGLYVKLSVEPRPLARFLILYLYYVHSY